MSDDSLQSRITSFQHSCSICLCANGHCIEHLVCVRLRIIFMERNGMEWDMDVNSESRMVASNAVNHRDEMFITHLYGANDSLILIIAFSLITISSMRMGIERRRTISSFIIIYGFL